MASGEITVSPSTPMPPGYKLLRKGYPFMTALCRRKTLAAGQTLYVVRAGSKTLGLRAPRRIVNEVHQEEHQSRATRRAAVAARDDSVRHAFETAIVQQYPSMPAEDVDKVLRRALKKRSGRVGRTSKLGIEDKVRLAVAAHVRHGHTDYDQMVRGEKSREEARKAVYNSVHRVLVRWKGGREQKKKAPEVAAQAAPKVIRDIVREEDSRRQRPQTRSTSKTTSSQLLAGLDGDEEAAISSLDDPILISSDSEEDSVDILIISSDEE